MRLSAVASFPDLPQLQSPQKHICISFPMPVTKRYPLSFLENSNCQHSKCMLLQPWLLGQKDILTTFSWSIKYTQIVLVWNTERTWISALLNIGYTITCFNDPYTIAIAVFQAAFGQGIGPVFLSNVRCTGAESSLLSCSHSGIGVSYCSHYEDAGVVCPPRK